MAQKTFILGKSRTCSMVEWGFSVPRIRRLCRLTFLFTWNVSSSVKSRRPTKSSSSMSASISTQNWWRTILSFGVKACTIYNLYGLMTSRLRRTRHTVFCGSCSWRLAQCVDFCGLALKASLILSTSESDTRGRPLLLLLHTELVSSNWLYQR
jgi:hypothetical protein